MDEDRDQGPLSQKSSAVLLASSANLLKMQRPQVDITAMWIARRQPVLLIGS